jgi:5-methylcytosine-specific restriction endonuclease McrA
MARGSDRRWRQLRAAILTASDVCWICGRRGADTVDHRIPVALRPDLEYVPTNLAPAHGKKRDGCPGNYGRTPRRRGLNTSRSW